MQTVYTYEFTIDIELKENLQRFSSLYIVMKLFIIILLSDEYKILL